MLCVGCQSMWNANPSIANRKGNMCWTCKTHVLQMNKAVISGEVEFRFINPTFRAKTSEEKSTSRQHDSECQEFSRLSKDLQVETRRRHEDEVGRRIGWCLKNNMTPAHEFVHNAPGDDSNFMVFI